MKIMKIECKSGCEDPGFFNIIEPIGAAVRPDGTLIDRHLIELDLINEALEDLLECPLCGGGVTITGD